MTRLANHPSAVRSLDDPLRSRTQAALDIAVDALAMIAISSPDEHIRQYADKALQKIETLTEREWWGDER